MAECEYLPGCPFFNDKMKNMPAIADQFKKKYCLGENSTCARFVVLRALGREKVPATLFPNQMDKAQGILAAG